MLVFLWVVLSIVGYGSMAGFTYAITIRLVEFTEFDPAPVLTAMFWPFLLPAVLAYAITTVCLEKLGK